ncbi:enoyl-CoA hydratase/isomerase family protein [Allonocardiopsis opalescens]|uniref:Enoyl-CoA hydratase n=1 Tax=Allonocardiopsis opalescens TaxID=1144618 RepID=A0A2T0Q4F9_9ACTN|nr:enoyl-CoA hydratase/isomerase family protein [Allonocardiopsis opalescens]PRX98591.1 enoyl-CoA hydratase [Allonocardiopsis opalescens]
MATADAPQGRTVPIPGESVAGTPDSPTVDDLHAAGLRFDIEPGGELATITLDRPERHNAMRPSTWLALARIGRTLPAGVRVVVLRGAGRSFSAGIDVQMFSPEGVDGEPDLLALSRRPEELTAAIAAYQEGFRWLRRPDIVSVAAVHGHAIGAGFQLALSCDLRVLADDARLCMKEPALGIVPDLTGTKPLVDTVGLARAIEMCLTARTVPADEALRLRLAELVVPGDQLDATVADLAAALCAVDRGAATATKALLQQAPGNTLDGQLAAERAAQAARMAEVFGGSAP